jgi:hypothetical protein
MFLLLAKYWDDQIDDDEMLGACGINGSEVKMHTEIW